MQAKTVESLCSRPASVATRVAAVAAPAAVHCWHALVPPWRLCGQAKVGMGLHALERLVHDVAPAPHVTCHGQEAGLSVVRSNREVPPGSPCLGPVMSWPHQRGAHCDRRAAGEAGSAGARRAAPLGRVRRAVRHPEGALGWCGVGRDWGPRHAGWGAQARGDALSHGVVTLHSDGGATRGGMRRGCLRACPA